MLGEETKKFKTFCRQPSKQTAEDNHPQLGLLQSDLSVHLYANGITVKNEVFQ